MPNFRETRVCILRILIETSLSTNKNLRFYTMLITQQIQSFLTQCNYEKIHFDEKTEDECMAEFRF